MQPQEAVTRDIMGNVPAILQIAFYLAALLVCSLAGYAFLRRSQRYRRGKSDAPEELPHRSLVAGLGAVLSYLALQKPLWRDGYAGLAHLLTVYGFGVLFMGTCLVFLEHDTPLHFLFGRFYLIASLLIDLGGVAFIVGLVMFLGRRLLSHASRLLSAWWVVALAWLLLAIGVSGFLLEAARLARDMPVFERWSVVGYGIALGLRRLGMSGEVALMWHRALWITHAVFCVAFFALLPWRFFAHMVYGAVSWATRTARPLGQLRLPNLVRQAPGAVRAEDLPWYDLLQADACTTCGRCNQVCPAHAAGKALRPREVVLGLRAAFEVELGPAGGNSALSTHIADAMLWSCTACMACNQVCPVGIEIVDKIVEARRGRVETGTVPEAAVQVFESTAMQDNPFGKASADRLAWASGLNLPVAQADEPIVLLYWIGCAGSFDPDGQAVSRAMTKILNHLGINYRVLGRRECCTGDPARRLGEEGLFQQLARQNIARLKHHGVVRVLTQCPHCFNTFRNEYPALGAAFAVEHHSQFLAHMIRDGKLRLPSGRAETVVFHDPCYLGRGNGETAAPREVLGALPQVQMKEMPRSGTDSFCCGAGGGAMWLDLPGTVRIETLRAEEAAATGATTVATACPFCKTMLEAGKQVLEPGGNGLAVKDLAELVVEAEGL
jgi:Fe-S oxidoreductase/nitrate reductase gamma subunit